MCCMGVGIPTSNLVSHACTASLLPMQTATPQWCRLLPPPPQLPPPLRLLSLSLRLLLCQCSCCGKPSRGGGGNQVSVLWPVGTMHACSMHSPFNYMQTHYLAMRSVLQCSRVAPVECTTPAEPTAHRPAPAPGRPWPAHHPTAPAKILALKLGQTVHAGAVWP